MNTKESTDPKIQVAELKDLDPEMVADFYRKIFTKRQDILPQIYRWLYRLSDTYESGPLVILDNNKMIGHLGVIPFEVEIEGKIHQSNFPVDLILLPEFRKKGLGLMLVENLMKNSEVSLGLRANEISKNALTKLGYMQSDQTYSNTFFIKPFDYPSLSEKLPLSMRNIFNRLVYPFLYLNYRRYSFPLKTINENIPDTEVLGRFVNILKNERLREEKNCISVVRDMKYFTWRLLNSPHKDKYRIIEIPDFMAVIKLNNIFIDILCITNRSDFHSTSGIISSLAIWGKKNGYSYIRFYTSDKQLSKFLNRRLFSYVTNPLFLFYSKNQELMNKIKQSKWNLELIDSDFEQFN